MACRLTLLACHLAIALSSRGEGTTASRPRVLAAPLRVDVLAVREVELAKFYRTVAHAPAKALTAHKLLTKYSFSILRAALHKRYGKIPKGWGALGPDGVPRFANRVLAKHKSAPPATR